MPLLIPITDPADPRIEAYRDIRERDLVGRERMFVAEGKVVVEKLIEASRHRPASLLIADKRVAGLTAMLDRITDDVPVYVAAQAVIDAVAGFPLHRGILAIGRRMDDAGADSLLTSLGEGAATVLLLSGIANHDNMGGILRNAAAFGVDAVLLDADCCDPLYRKAIRVSVGAALLAPMTRLARGDDPVALLGRHGFVGVALSPEGTTLLHEWRPGQRNAVVLGAEGPGLAPTLIARMRSLRIEMASGFDSLNVATTSGIVLHHLAAAGISRSSA